MAGGGKTSTALMKLLGYIDDPAERILVARRSRPELIRPGGLVSESNNFYPYFGGQFNKTELKWSFPSGAEIQFLGIPDESMLGSMQGAQLSRIIIEEAADGWSLDTVLFLLSRLRSASAKRKETMIMTCNPDPNSFLKEWVEYALDADGVPKPGSENIVRYFCVIDGKVLWGNSREECFELHGKPRGMVDSEGMSMEQIRKIPRGKMFSCKSFRFIFSTVYDNPYLLPPRNNSYLPNLLAQPKRNQLKFLSGSWANIDVGQNLFSRAWTPLITMKEVPADIEIVRSYDLAGTERSEVNRNPDATAGVMVGRDRFGMYYVLDVVDYHERSHTVLQNIIKQAKMDGPDVMVTVPQDAGAAGRYAADHIISVLSEEGVIVKRDKVSGWAGKLQRFLPFCQLAEAGKVKVVIGEWNDRFFSECEAFKGDSQSMRKQHDDIVDATSSAIKFLAKTFSTTPTITLGGASITKPSPLL